MFLKLTKKIYFGTNRIRANHIPNNTIIRLCFHSNKCFSTTSSQLTSNPNPVGIALMEKIESIDSPNETKSIKQSFWSKFRPSNDSWNHLCNLLVLGSMTCTTMIPMRSLLIGANVCAVSYFLTRNPKLFTPCIWSMVFILGHSAMIMLIIMENRSVQMSDIENHMYCTAFKDNGWTPVQFKKTLAISSFMRAEKGDVLCNEGHPRTSTMYVVGSVQLQQNGVPVGCIINGFIGDFAPKQKNSTTSTKRIENSTEEHEPKFVKDTISIASIAKQSDNKSKINEIDTKMDVTDPTKWTFTIVALDDCQVFVWDTATLHQYFDSNTQLKQAAVHVVSGDLSRKLRMVKKFNSLKTYKEMIKVAIQDEHITAVGKNTLKRFREKNDISDTEHSRIVQDLGWALDEFERGLKHETSWWETIENWYLLNLTSRYRVE